MSVEILIPRQLTQSDRLKASEDRGRHWKRVPGGYVHDLVGLQKAIVLCSFCGHKFDHRRVRYRKETDFQAVGRCDGCKAHDIRCTLYVAEETYSQVRMTRADTRVMHRQGKTFVGG